MSERRTCSVAECDRVARSSAAEYCEAHYYRLRRNGRLTLKDCSEYAVAPPAAERKGLDGRGYVRVYNVDHPLAKGRSVFEHRMVAYDARAGADPSCEWCGLALTWDMAVIDHADDDPTNNAPSNLVVSCQQCNVARGGCSARRFAEGVAVRVLCRVYAEQRAAIVAQVMERCRDVGARADSDDELHAFTARILASGVQARGPRGTRCAD